MEQPKLPVIEPILKGFHPDPSICRVGDDFYLVTSTFEFYPGVPVFHSRDLIRWELINYCLTRPDQVDLTGVSASGGIWAPTIRCHNGRFYMTTTCVHGKQDNFIVWTDDIRSEWSCAHHVAQDGIDPSLFFDDDGKVYFCSARSVNGKNQIDACEINPDTGEMLTEPVCISYGSGGIYPEGPHIYKKDGIYYLLLAEGGTGYRHMVTVLRAPSPYGPYESCPHNPVLTHLNLQEDPIQATGHADIIEDQNGRWWLVCLGFRPLDSRELHVLGRESFLAPMHWEDGWPVIGNHGRLAPLSDFAHLLPARPEKRPIGADDFFDDFTAARLSPQYAFIRSCDARRYSLEPGKGRLTLSGAGVHLCDAEATPVFLGVRQREFCGICQANLTVEAGALAGITAFYNDSYHYAAFVENRGGKIHAGIKKAIHDIRIHTRTAELTSANVTLTLRFNREWYEFSVTSGYDTFILGRGAVAGLCSECVAAHSFTGVFLGMYCESGHVQFRSFRISYSEDR